MGCVFAKGKTNERELSGASPPGSFALPVENASAYFDPGDLIFISDAEGAGVEFLGPATAVSESEVRCLLGLAGAYEAGDLCWKPTNFFLWKERRSLPARRILDTGVESRRSAGGVLYLTRISEAFFSEILRFEKVRMKKIAEFVVWVEEVLEGGVEKFSFCDEDRSVSVAALLSSEIVQDEKSPDAVALEMKLERVEEEKYF